MRLALEVVLQDALGAVGVAGLSVESGSRVMGNHAVSAAKGVLHGAPDVILGSGLHIPDITSVATDLTAGESLSDGILVADCTAGSVDEPCTLLEVLEEIGIDESTSAFVQRAVDGDDVALGDEFLEILDAACFDSLRSSCGRRQNSDLSP